MGSRQGIAGEMEGSAALTLLLLAGFLLFYRKKNDRTL